MKKIMFNDKYGLTQAVLEDRKTMTRRVIKCPSNAFGFRVMRNGVRNWFVETCDDDERPIGYIEPAYKVGEVVAIAQRYTEVGTVYYEDWQMEEDWFEKGCKNKMSVKADLMPHHIKITDIKVERLQDISDEDCIKEGLYEDYNEHGGLYTTEFYDYKGNKSDGFDTPREAYASLIDRISGKGTWDKNPWVFAYSFKLID